MHAPLRDRRAGDRVEPGDVGGLDQPLAGQGVAAGGQPPERHPVQPLNAEAGPQPAMKVRDCLAGGAVDTEVVVGLLAAAGQIPPQVATNPGDLHGLELPRHKHPPHPADSTTTEPAKPTPLTGILTGADRTSAAPSARAVTRHLPRRPRLTADASRCPATPGQL